MNAFERLLGKVLGIYVEHVSGVIEHLWPDFASEEDKVETKPERKYDRRLLLKIKLKNLREEVALIRSHEERLKIHMMCWREESPASVHAREMINQMRAHRRRDIREEARATLLAYGYIRGLAYAQIEQNPRHEYYMTVQARVDRVAKMVQKYSAMGWNPQDIVIFQTKIRVWMGVDDIGNRLRESTQGASVSEPREAAGSSAGA